MAGELDVGVMAGCGLLRAQIVRTPRARGLVIGVLILLGLLCASAASADSLALMSGAGQHGLGGSAGQQPIVAQVRDVDGVVVVGRTIHWATSNGFVLSASSSVTDANGNASVDFTYGDYGTASIVASDSVGATSAQALETSEGSDSITLISGGGQAGLIGTMSSQPIVVQVLNAAGAPIAGRTVSWVDQTAYSQVAAASSLTNANGQASMSFNYLQGPGLGASGSNIDIRAANGVGGQFVDIAESSNGSGTSISTPESLSGILGSTSVPIVLQIKNADGSPAVGVTVNWADRGVGTAIVTPSTATTVTDGTGHTTNTVQYTFCGAPDGTGDLEMTFGGGVNDIPYTITCTGSLTLLSTKPLSGPSGGPTTSPMLVESHNQDGTIPSGGTMSWSVSIGDAIPNAATSVIDGSGKASMGFTVGTVPSTVCATDPDGRMVCSGVNLVASETIRVVSGEGQIGTANSPGAAPIVVEVLDATGSPINGRVINWSQAPVDPGASVSIAASSTTNASGQAQATFTYQQAGRTTIVATNSATGTQLSIRATAVGADTFTVISGNHQSGLVGTHSAQPVIAELRDGAGNPRVGVSINWSYNCGGVCNMLDSTTSVTDANGRVSNGFTFASTAGQSGFEADGPNSRARAEFNAIAVGANAINLISGTGQTGLPGAAGAQPMVVEVRDAAGAVVAGRTINWNLVSGDATRNASSSVTDASGRASMGFTYGPSEPTTSMFAAVDSVSGQQVQFAMTTSHVLNHGVFVSGGGQSGLPGTAGAQPIVVAVLDSSNQPVPGETVTWSVVSGSATLDTVTNTTDANGQVHANFNFGPIPGTSIIQASGGPSPDDSRIQTTVTALGNNQTLTIVSGDTQVLVGNTPSQPLVVQLKNFSNAPVVGATINWTATNGSLALNSSITDANGHASNTVTTTGTGAVTVHANSVLASAPVTFDLSTGLADLPGLTPQEHAVAGAIDAACPALAGMSNLTPAQADLLAQCEALNAAAGINGGATVTALEQLVTKSATVQSNAAVTAQTAQFQNINLRLNALRSKSPSSSLSGLAFAGSGGVIPLASLMNTFLGDANPAASGNEAGASSSRWGFFATGTIGRGDADAHSLTPAYNYDINGLTAGIDYRQRDNWVYGAAVGFSRQNTDLDHAAGAVRMTGWSLSTYSTWSFKNNLYVDGVLTWGNNAFDISRRIDYTLPTPGGGTTSVHQDATSSPGGDLFSAALTFGGDFHKDAWNISPYAQIVSSRMGFDSYRENLQAGPGNGLGLAVDARTVNSLSSVLGTRISFTNSTNWGVFIPTASFEWQHEFKSDLSAVTARFLNDPTQTSFSLSGTPMDNSFFRMGLGMSFVWPHGKSGFILYEHMLGREGMSQDNLGLGMRIEF